MNRKLSIILILFFLCGCSETTFLINSAKRITDLDNKPTYKIGNPYKVKGQWFYPAVDYNYDEIGIASWYGPNFHGKKTANGEIFDQNTISAAHKTLPLPSIVKVTNLENNLSLEIRINDRGPFIRGRIIDLSKEAAKELDFFKNGTAKVRVQIVEDKSRKIALDYENYKTYLSDVAAQEDFEKLAIPKIKKEKNNENNKKINSKKSENKNKIHVQVAAFNDIRNANDLIKKLSDFKVFVKRDLVGEKYFYRVRIGPIFDMSFAERIKEKLFLKGFNKSRIIIEAIK
ncbi:septal ring lytic transglycosylase RlpA family protein [Rickettsiales bacterium]|nr:septal ring lytic transglycosylase RlpA family protein [Rickettsiales bacterium]